MFLFSLSNFKKFSWRILANYILVITFCHSGHCSYPLRTFYTLLDGRKTSWINDKSWFWCTGTACLPPALLTCTFLILRHTAEHKFSVCFSLYITTFTAIGHSTIHKTAQDSPEKDSWYFKRTVFRHSYLLFWIDVFTGMDCWSQFIF